MVKTRSEVPHQTPHRTNSLSTARWKCTIPPMPMDYIWLSMVVTIFPIKLDFVGYYVDVYTYWYIYIYIFSNIYIYILHILYTPISRNTGTGKIPQLQNVPRPRPLVRRCSQSGATSMKHGESSNGVDWPAGRMVLDMTLDSIWCWCFAIKIKDNYD